MVSGPWLLVEIGRRIVWPCIQFQNLGHVHRDFGNLVGL